MILPPLDGVTALSNNLLDSSPRRNDASSKSLRPSSSSNSGSTRQPALDVVQFSCPIYYVEEDGGFLSIDILRLGSPRGTCSVHYDTENGSAVDGKQYRRSVGRVEFGPGEYMKSIEVYTIESDNWNATLEFKVKLEGEQDCKLGAYLYTARVKVIDNDTFPSSKYKSSLEPGGEGVEHVSGSGLFIEYMKLNYYFVDGCKWRTLVTIAGDQLKNIYLLLTMLLGIFMVDTLFNTACKPGPNSSHTDQGHKELCNEEIVDMFGGNSVAIGVGLLYLVPFGILHLWDNYEIKMNLHGVLTDFLQTSLLRKYMNYSEESRANVLHTQIESAILIDCDDVAGGYCAVLDLIQLLGKLLVLIGFVLFKLPSALPYVLAMPSLMFTFAYLRSSAVSRAQIQLDNCHQRVHTLVANTCQNYSVIADYFQRPTMNDTFKERVEERSRCRVRHDIVKNTNNYFPKWLAPVFICCYIGLESPAVLSDEHPLGSFLAMIGVFKEVSSDFEELYGLIMQVSSLFDPLKGITSFFNLPTELKQWKKLNRERRESMKEERRRAAGQDKNFKPGECAEDFIPISLNGMNYSYRSKPIFKNVCVRAPQGRLIAVHGAMKCGKSTFMRILSHGKFADPAGSVFVPPHLRVLHVSQTPVILSMSPWRNLTFGLPAGRQEKKQMTGEDIDRVYTILRLLNMQVMIDKLEEEDWSRPNSNLSRQGNKDARTFSRCSVDSANEYSRTLNDDSDHEVNYTQDEDDEEDGAMVSEDLWVGDFSYSEQMLIHLARAFVMNPEVLVLQRPMQHLGHQLVPHLREQVRNRGLAMNKENVIYRRPRTIFFTPERKDEIREADIIWEIADMTVHERANHGFVHTS